MTNCYTIKRTILILILASVFTVHGFFDVGRLQRVHITGKVLCNGTAFVGLSIELWEYSLIWDQILNKTVTNRNGEYEISGSKSEIFEIAPFLKLNHDCTAQNKTKKIDIFLSYDKYVNLGVVHAADIELTNFMRAYELKVLSVTPEKDEKGGSKVFKITTANIAETPVTQLLNATGDNKLEKSIKPAEHATSTIAPEITISTKATENTTFTEAEEITTPTTDEETVISTEAPEIETSTKKESDVTVESETSEKNEIVV
uniref:Protein lethal(3)malignant blood neoplasm 1 n=1 Tax=Rhabditophanes sp. KR3021 TaxID=114890 RepID=A0AC35U6I6_9BILA